MTEPAVQIDLGLDRDLPDPGARPPGRCRTRAKAAAAAGCLVLALAALDASVPPASPELARAATIALHLADRFAVAGDLVLVSSTVDDGAGVLTGYDLASGRRRWQVPTRAGGGAFMQADTTDGVLVVYEQADRGPTTTVRSARTGAEIWSTAAYVGMPAVGSTAVVSESLDPLESGSTRAPTTATGPTTVRAVDIPTGQTRWTVDYREFVNPALSPDGRQVITITGDGTLEVRDLPTGGVVATARVFGPGAAARTMIQLVPGTILAMDIVDDTTTALDQQTLAVRWSRAIRYLGMSDCGRLLCLMDDIGSGTSVQGVDPATGTVAWHRTDMELIFPVGGRLLGFTDGPTAPLPVGAVDTATGLLTVDLRGWSLITADDDRPALLIRQLAGRGRAEIGQLAAGAGAVRVLGRLTGTGTGCVGRDHTVVCRESPRRLTAWRLRNR